MCVVWDKCTITITNNTGSPLTVSTQNTQHGTWDTAPADIAAAVGSTNTFAGRSTCGNASNGCEGTVTYSLDDGTLFNVSYLTSYFYGIADDSQYSCGFQGARANLYSKTLTHSSAESNGGAGKRVTVTIAIGKKP